MTTSEPGASIPVQARGRRSAPPGLAQARRTLLELRDRRAAGDRPRLLPVPRDRLLPLSFAQQRLWFLDQWFTDRPVYNSPLALRARGPLDVAALRAALAAVLGRHEALRTRYEADRGVPYQLIEPPPDEAELALVDLTATGEPAPERRRRARAELRDLVRTPFDLARGPLLRGRLIRLDDDDHVLGLCTHHIATDGWSGDIFTREIIACYEAALTGAEPDLPDLPVQYADYAVWQRERQTGEHLERQLGYWREKLAGLPVLDLPADRPRPAEPGFRGRTLTLELPDRMRTGLGELARREHATLLTVLLAGFTALLSRHTGQDDIVLGSIFSGRTEPEIEPLIGFFANTLVLRTDASGDPSFRELVARTHDTVVGAHLHQEVNFNRLVEELAPERDTSRNPLFQTSFTLQHAVPGHVTVEGLQIEPERVQVGTARFDLAVHVTEMAGRGLELWAEFSTELFDTARIRRLLDQYGRVLAQVMADPAKRIGELELLGPDELARVREQSAAPAPAGAADRCLHELFEERAAASPERVACRYLGKDVTYGELNEAANRIAWWLRRAEPPTGPETVVGVLLDRGPALAESFLGVLKAGGAYLPLDPDHPADRIAYMVRDSGCRTVLTTRRLAALLPAGVQAVVVDGPGQSDAVAGAPAHDPPPAAVPGNAAYLVYTSGSTGRPKGVVVEHRQIVNFTRSVVEMFRITPGDRLLQFANPAFDTSAFDFYGALTTGAALVQAPTSTLHDPRSLTALMRDEGVTVTDLPPTVLAELDPAALPRLRALFVGMEPFPAELVNRWNTPGREFHNGYGPTEATVACVDHLCPDGRLEGVPPIGLPMAGCTAHVLDRFARTAPSGVTGELFVGGDCVARGYHGRPGRTAERFVPDPFGPPGSRLYRTGDLARRGADGVLVFHGRADSQIKIRGLRVEPGEIEARLLEHPRIGQAVVAVKGEGAAARLVAYLLPADGGGPDGSAPDAGTPDTRALRRHLLATVPQYMVPADYVWLDAFPKNVNGKIDRARLPVPGAGAAPAPARVAPRTPAEARLAEIWRAVLGGRDEVGVEDDFFALGGNSLKFAQIAARIRDAFGVPVELRELFARPTIAELAELVDGAADGTVPAPEQPAARLNPLRSAGSRPPLFLLHPSGGSTLPYGPLVRTLGEDQPCFGVDAAGLDGAPPLAAVPDMVERYRSAIKTVRPEGPYHLAGWSLGGTLAHALATRLRAGGDEVALLALLDAGPPRRLASPPDDCEILAQFAESLAADQPSAGRLSISAAGLRDVPPDERVPAVLRRLAEADAVPAGTESFLRVRLAVFEATVGACATWCPERFDGRIDLVCAAEGHPAADTARGWADWTTGEVVTHRVPGGHYDLMGRGGVEPLAEILRSRLDRVR